MYGTVAIRYEQGCWFVLFIDGDTVAASQDLPNAKTAEEAWTEAHAIEESGDF